MSDYTPVDKEFKVTGRNLGGPYTVIGTDSRGDYRVRCEDGSLGWLRREDAVPGKREACPECGLIPLWYDDTGYKPTHTSDCSRQNWTPDRGTDTEQSPWERAAAAIERLATAAERIAEALQGGRGDTVITAPVLGGVCKRCRRRLEPDETTVATMTGVICQSCYDEVMSAGTKTTKQAPQ